MRAGLTALLSALAVFIVPAAAQAACQATPTTKPFTVLGDSQSYSLVPNGGFESGTGGWSLSAARVASGNEPWSVRAAGDSKSLAIDSSGTAVSPVVCIDINRPTYRFFAHRTSGSWGVLNLRVRYTDSSGHTNETTVAALDSNFGTAWGASPIYNIASMIGLWNADQDSAVQFVFDPENSGGAWSIDDVYVDPYGRG